MITLRKEDHWRGSSATGTCSMSIAEDALADMSGVCKVGFSGSAFLVS